MACPVVRSCMVLEVFEMSAVILKDGSIALLAAATSKSDFRTRSQAARISMRSAKTSDGIPTRGLATEGNSTSPGLKCSFGPCDARDAVPMGLDHLLHHPIDYSVARTVGLQAYSQRHQVPVIQYCSVRNPGATCWGLLSPRPVTDVIQTFHCQFVMRAGGLIADVQYIQSVGDSSH